MSDSSAVPSTVPSTRTPNRAPSTAGGAGPQSPMQVQPQSAEGPTHTETRHDEAPQLPHERDQSNPTAHSQPDPMIQQAHDDLASGQVDTDLRNTGGLDHQRREKLVRRAGHG